VDVPPCAFGDLNSKRTVVIYGNSQAQMWMPALVTIATDEHLRLVPVIKAACGDFLDPGYVGPGRMAGTTCYQFAEHSAARIRALHPAALIIAATPGNVLAPGASPTAVGPDGLLPESSLRAASPRRTVAAARRFVGALGPEAPRLIIMGDVSYLPVARPSEEQPADCLLANAHTLQKCFDHSSHDGEQ
jgi:hypothetical protein